jgi:FkbM family methyltransferase
MVSVASLTMIKGIARRYRRKLLEQIGIDSYSRPSLNGIDKKLQEYIPYRNGFFVEAGANDGYTQSNTYYFERFLGWTGILVEPIPELYKKCKKERPKSRVLNCALVSDEHMDPNVDMVYVNLMSLVKGAQKSHEADMEHIRRGLSLQTGTESYEIRVPARTLTSILEECCVKEIDLISLDAEGYELNILKGLDLQRYRPSYMLIEARYRDEIDDYVSRYYTRVAQFSQHDYLYRCKI